MPNPRDLGWEYGEPTSYPAGRRPVRRPLPSPSTTRLANRVRLTTYRVPWWRRVEWWAVVGIGVSVFGLAYLLGHLLRWIGRGAGS